MPLELVALSIKDTKFWRDIFSSLEATGKPTNDGDVYDTNLIW